MPPASLRRTLAALVAAAAVAACDGGPTPAPTEGPTTPPASPGASSAPTEPPATATPGPTATPGSLSGLAITTAPFARINGTTLAFSAPDDGSGRILVGDREGRIYAVARDGVVAKRVVADLRARIKSGGEQGLLGIAVHPAFPTDPRVFVDFTNTDGDTIIASLALDAGDPDRLDPASFKQLLFIDQPFGNHNGGSLQFGPDGYLTIAMGDGGSGGDPQGNGQNVDALLGKILRIDVDGPPGSGPYAIPAENPYAKSGGRPEVWLAGLRNPWRTSFDRTTGDFWLGDVGQREWEEVDVIRAGTPGPLNLGWNVMEGAHCYGARTCDQAPFVAPVVEYGHDLGCAVIGGFVYRGTSYPFLVGTYLFSDSCTSRVWAIDAASDGPSVPVQVGQVKGNVASFGQDERGELYVLTLGGTVERIVATQR